MVYAGDTYVLVPQHRLAVDDYGQYVGHSNVSAACDRCRPPRCRLVSSSAISLSLANPGFHEISATMSSSARDPRAYGLKRAIPNSGMAVVVIGAGACGAELAYPIVLVRRASVTRSAYGDYTSPWVHCAA